MAKETETATETQSDTVQATDTKKEATVDYEAKYKTSQAEIQKLAEDNKSKEELLDAVSPYVNWDAAGGKTTTPEKQTDTDDEGYVSKKSMQEAISGIETKSNSAIMALQFQVAHPELAPYEKTLVGPTILRMRKEHPHESLSKILERTAESVNKFLEGERAKGAEKAKEAQEKKDEELANVSGLEAAGTTTPTTEERGETKEEYLSDRQAQLAKKKSL